LIGTDLLALEATRAAGGARDRPAPGPRALTQEEVLDGLLLALAAMVVLPILPDRPLGPFGAVNPARVWRLVVLVMAVGVVGHLGMRLLGTRFGVPIAALTANTLVKIAIAFAAGPRGYGARVAGGLVLLVAAAWLGWFAGAR
jgi:uncharacterized membrane protein (DUF4010 family)